MLNKIDELPALLGGSPVRQEPLPLYNTIDDAEKNAVMEVLDSGVLSGFAAQPNDDFYGGKWIKALEDEFCKYFNVKHAVAINSATTGLHAAVSAMGVGPGDEVIVPPYTMSATATCVLFCGAVPVFADIDDEIFCIDPESVESNINSNTKGIIAVNLYGHPARLTELKAIADKHGLFLIEDNAQAPGALIDGKFAGTIGDAGIFSLNRHKIIQCGEGGVVVTNNDEIAMKMRLMRNHGEVIISGFGIDDVVNTTGLNYRLCNMEAAIARIQLTKLDDLNEKRIALANRLHDNFKAFDFIKTPVVKENCSHVYYFFTMKYDEDKAGLRRDVFCRAIEAEGYVMKAGYVKPIYLEPIYQKKMCFGKEGFPFSANDRNKEIKYEKGICPVVERLQDKELMWTSSIYPPLTHEDMDKMTDAISKIIKHKDKLNSL